MDGDCAEIVLCGGSTMGEEDEVWKKNEEINKWLCNWKNITREEDHLFFSSL